MDAPEVVKPIVTETVMEKPVQITKIHATDVSMLVADVKAIAQAPVAEAVRSHLIKYDNSRTGGSGFPIRPFFNERIWK